MSAGLVGRETWLIRGTEEVRSAGYNGGLRLGLYNRPVCR